MARKKSPSKAIMAIKAKLENIFILNTTISLYLFLVILYKKLLSLDLDQRAAAVSYSFILAVFPATLFLFTLIPLIPIAHLDVLIMDFLKSLMPASLYESVASTIFEIISRPRLDILSFGFLFAIYAATNGMMSLMQAFNMALRQREKRHFLKARAIAFLLTFILILVLLLAIIILIVGKLAFSFAINKGFWGENFSFWGIQLLGYITVFLIFFFGISSIYYFAPAMHRKLKFFNFGALFSSVLCILSTNLFSFYFENFSSYNKLYGSIGTLIAIMVWIYLISLILILGFEVNISFRTAMSKIHDPST
jgi:membrane protein